MKELEKMMPQSIEAELGVLGSIIIDPEAADQVIGYLRPTDFYRSAHQVLYETIVNLRQRGVAADFITICDDLERRGKLESIGGASYIVSLMNEVPTSGNVDYYGRIVQRTSVLRRLIAAVGEIAGLAYEADQEVEQILERAERTIFEISQDYLLSTSSDVGMGPLMSQYLEILERRYEMRGEVIGVPTGYEDLDRLLGGLQRSELAILAARTSIGKSALAINIAYNAAVKYQRGVGIFSLEMSREQLAQRFVALEAGIEQQKLRTGRIVDEDWEPLVDAVGKLAELGERGIRIDFTSEITLLQMRSQARRWVLEYGIELIIVDYLQLVKGDESRKYENRQQEVSAISRGLKGMARELNVSVLALAQLSRALEQRQSKVPQLSDLRESGSIENDADLVMFIYRDEIYNPNTERRGQADILVAKQRNGPLGEVTLLFDQAKSRFSDLDIAVTPSGEIVFAREGDEGAEDQLLDMEEKDDEEPRGDDVPYTTP
jgi:replicative DNA helicase